MARANRRDVLVDQAIQAVPSINRFVRRAFLCGDDQLYGKNYDQRRERIRDRLVVAARSSPAKSPHSGSTPAHTFGESQQRSRTNSFAVPRKHRRQRLRRPRPVRLRPIDGPHASSKHTSVHKALTEMHLRQKRQVDGPSFASFFLSSGRSQRDAALCLTTNQPSSSSVRKNSLRRARENTRVRRTIVTADLECGDFAGNERGATTRQR
jgi:hypothetical protein